MATMKFNGAGTYAAFAGADLTGKVNYLAKIDANGNIVLAGAGDTVIGNILEDGAADRPISVQTNGNGKCILGATVAAGAKMQADANGAGITLASGDAFGVALQGGLVNEIIEFTFDK